VILAALWLASAGLEDLSGTDKLLHFGACSTLTVVGYGAAAAFDAPLPVRLGVGAGAAAVVGLAKEGADLAGFGDPSLGDLAYDALGIGAGVGVALVIDAAVHRSRLASE
jgi:hypothetical protein